MLKMIAVDDEPLALQSLQEAMREIQLDHTLKTFTEAAAALAYARENRVDVALLDIRLIEGDGISLGADLQDLYPDVNLIYTTAWSHFMERAFYLHASGYVLKPITADKLRKELMHLRRPAVEEKKRVSITAFGYFEIMVDGRPLIFHRERTKELLAILVDAQGQVVAQKTMLERLWEDNEEHRSYLRDLKQDLKQTLKKMGCEEIIGSGKGTMWVNPETVDCDLFSYARGEKRLYRGAYMNQYSWAEATNGYLLRENGLL